MRWFLTPAEVHAILKGEQVPSAYCFKPMFYPRQATALLDSKRLLRSRIKSGLANVKFCSCPVKKGRHVLGNPCKVYAEKNAGTENSNITVTGVGKTIKISEKKRENDGVSITFITS